MTIFGKRLSEYIVFAKLFLILIFAAGAIRLTLSLNGVPFETTRWFSMTALAWLGTIYYSIRVHTTGFGSFKQLLVILILQDWIAQAEAALKCPATDAMLAAVRSPMDLRRFASNLLHAPEFTSYRIDRVPLYELVRCGLAAPEPMGSPYKGMPATGP